MEFLKALQENEDKHQAATKIALLYRRSKAQKYVQQRRHQRRLENVLKDMHKIDKSFVTFQQLFRRRSSTAWIAKFGIHFFDRAGKRRRKKAMLPGAKSKFELPEKGSSVYGLIVILTSFVVPEMRDRINFEIQQRRLLSRNDLFCKLYEKYVSAAQLVEVNITTWLTTDRLLAEKEAQLLNLIKGFNEEHDVEMQRIAALKAEVF
jgi:hypothetical protein